MSDLLFLIIGALAGYLSAQFTGKRTFGLLGNIVIGVIGAIIGGKIFGFLNISAGGGFFGALITATCGALVALWILKKLKL